MIYLILNRQQVPTKNGYNIFKIDGSQMGRLMQKYSRQNLFYRSEEFTQQAELFVSRITSDKRSKR